jgi:transposase
MKLMGKVYDNDAQTQNLTKEERLAYHQQHSKPIMDLLKEYIDTLLSARHVEPNSDLGAAIQYMQKRWGKLTRFLTVAGAPLDNNIVERALKIAIRNRKAALFYKTEYSAQIGGMITSLIYTCVLSKVNPFHYLTVLQQYQEQVNKSPSLWLPWNHQETLELNLRPPPQPMASDANLQATQQSVDYPVAA